MTLDSLLSALGSSGRNLGSASLVLLQQQQAAAGGGGCGGALALLHCALHALTHAKRAKSRGVIVLSMEHVGAHWTQPSAAPATAALILDACSRRFELTPEAAAVAAESTTATAASAASSPSLALPGRDTVRALHSAQIKSLRFLQRTIEEAAEDMHRRWDETHSSRAPSAVSALAAPAVAAASSDPYSDEAFPAGGESFAADCVHVLIDDLMSLIARFGASPVIALLQALQTNEAGIAVIAAVDLDGLATLPPLRTGSGTANNQQAHAAVPLHSHLAALATTTVSIRALTPLSSPAGGVAAAAYAASISLTHKRPSGKVTTVAEEVEIRPTEGVVKKRSSSAKESEGKGGAHAAPPVAAAASSLAAQFGSSFSLDLSSNARSARAGTVLPYQHTGEAASSLDAGNLDEDLLTDDDEDFDDPDDDLDV